jgi:hypothetical protein
LQLLSQSSIQRVAPRDRTAAAETRKESTVSESADIDLGHWDEDYDASDADDHSGVFRVAPRPRVATIAVEIRAARGRHGLACQLRALGRHLRKRCLDDSRDDGLLQQLCDSCPRFSRRAETLRDERRRLLSDAVVLSAAALGATPRGVHLLHLAAETLLRRLEVHDERESELLVDSLIVDLGVAG